MSLGDSASIILGRARRLARLYERRISKEFAVPLHCNGASGCYTASIPKPIIDHLGKGTDVEAITYLLKGKRVEIRKTGQASSE